MSYSNCGLGHGERMLDDHDVPIWSHPRNSPFDNYRPATRNIIKYMRPCEGSRIFFFEIPTAAATPRTVQSIRTYGGDDG